MREVQWMQWFAEAGPADEAARTGDTAPDAGEQEDFAALIRGRYKADFDARVQKILDGRLRGLRQENARLRQDQEQRRERARQAIESMAAQEEQVRQVYPEFRWQREMENPAFGRLVCAGVEPMARPMRWCIGRISCGGPWPTPAKRPPGRRHVLSPAWAGVRQRTAGGV